MIPNTIRLSVQRGLTYIRLHRTLFVGGVLCVGVFGYAAYAQWWSDDTEAKYVVGTVEKGELVATIAASGQVAASDETTIKAKVSGDVVSVLVKEGDQVKQGQVIATLDGSDAQRAVIDARLAVEEARLNLEHDTLQAPIDYKGLEEEVERAKRDLSDAYEEAYVALADAFVTVPDIVSGADEILYDKDIDPNSQNVNAYQTLFISADQERVLVRSYANTAEADYQKARDAYLTSAGAFKSLSRTSSEKALGEALSGAQDMATLLARAVVSETNLIDTVLDIMERRDWNIDPDIALAQTAARGYVTSANAVLTTLTNAEKAIEDARDTLIDAEHALELASVGNPTGENPFDLKLLENTLKQKEAALAEAQSELADHSIRVPFSGIVASVDVRRGDSVGTGGAVGSLISDQKIAELSLNEVDAAKIEIGDTVELSFDALDDVALTGSVAEVDVVGVVVQGVVSYTIKIGFDAQDPRVKPGMTANASIVVARKQNVLKVPSSAVKTQANGSYVLAFDPPLEAVGRDAVATEHEPARIPVEIGIADDTTVEIVSGLVEGQQIVVRTQNGSSAPTTSSNFRGPGGGIRP